MTHTRSDPARNKEIFCKINRFFFVSCRVGPGIIKDSSGQTLVALLAFMAMAIVLTTAATAVTLVNSQTSSKYSQGQEALRYAETGADNALQRLLRDPSYTGETLSVGTGTATIAVSGSGTKTIVSEGVSGSFRRKVQVTATQASNALTVTGWSEAP